MKIERVREFRKQMRERAVFGPFSKTRDPAMIEAIGHAGFDFVILDLEHGPNGLETVENLIRAAEGSGLVPIVRTRPTGTELVNMVLDLGAGGVQAPQVTTPEEAAAVVRATRFAPVGERGVCRYVRAARYSALPPVEYFAIANEAVVVVQLEGRRALEQLDAILDVPGVDIVFIGPYDLSQSLGVPGEVEHPRVVTCVERIVEACRRRNIVCGTFTELVPVAARWAARGMRYLSYSVDVGLMSAACAVAAAELREACAGLAKALEKPASGGSR